MLEQSYLLIEYEYKGYTSYLLILENEYNLYLRLIQEILYIQDLSLFVFEDLLVFKTLEEFKTCFKSIKTVDKGDVEIIKKYFPNISTIGTSLLTKSLYDIELAITLHQLLVYNQGYSEDKAEEYVRVILNEFNTINISTH